ncbi:MAG: peptidoglycan-binding protein [Leptolyngbyaceae cyanobacterium]
MKRWDLLAISNFWLTLGLLGILRTTALAAQTATASIEPDKLSNRSAVIIAQANEVLELGSSGNAVREVQAMLSLLGYYSGAVDGTYGEATMTAVNQFQADAGLPADGVVGPATWQRLLPTLTALEQPQQPDGSNSNDAPASPIETAIEPVEPIIDPAENPTGTAGTLPALQLGDQGEDVTTLQRRLAETGFYTGGIDGVFGLQTEQAVLQFQQQSGLDVDGVVGPATWTELLQ